MKKPSRSVWLLSMLLLAGVASGPIFAQSGPDVTLYYSTYLGGNNTDQGWAIAVDSSLSAYVTGYTYSTNFPCRDPYQSSRGGYYDAFIAKFSSTGSELLYSTYVGGTSSDLAYGIDSQRSLPWEGGRGSRSAFPPPFTGEHQKRSNTLYIRRDTAPDPLRTR